MAGHDRSKHTNRHKVDDVINALIHNPHIEDASKLTGVSLRTVYRWLATDEFKTKLREAKKQLFEEGNAILRAEYKRTCMALVKIRDDQYASEAVRLGAMRTLMEYSTQIDVIDSYDERLRKLESQSQTIEAAIPVAEREANDGWIHNNGSDNEVVYEN